MTAPGDTQPETRGSGAGPSAGGTKAEPTLPVVRVRTWPRLAGLLSLVAAAGLVAAMLMPGRTPGPLPVIAEIPDFSLVDAEGRTVTRADLLGRPWVADLVFTGCSGICPRMTREMKLLQDQTDGIPDLRLVSISVDPENDTPERLRDYGRRNGADPTRWTFLTGDRATIWKVANEGMKLPAFEGDVARGDEAVVHSPRFVLVDREGRVRGAYDIRDPEAMLGLRGDLRRIDLR